MNSSHANIKCWLETVIIFKGFGCLVGLNIALKVNFVSTILYYIMYLKPNFNMQVKFKQIIKRWDVAHVQLDHW